MSRAVTAVSPYLTTRELATRLRTTPGVVRKMRHRGTGPRGTKVGCQVLYHVADVQAWETAKAEADDIRHRAST